MTNGIANIADGGELNDMFNSASSEQMSFGNFFQEVVG